MSRFYTSEGTCIEGLRAARKLSPLPLPSVSTILSLLVSPGLVEYFKWQMWQSTVTTPRGPLMTDDEHYQACRRWADEHGLQARDKGSELHDLIQSYNLARKFQKPVPSPPERWAGQYRAYVGWYEENVAESLAVEEVLFGDGYAGRVDHICLLKDGRVVTVDTKTQNLVNKKKFSHYLSWAMQLGAYSGAWNMCEECGGLGGVDSGGVTPWGSGIMVPCPSCSNHSPNGLCKSMISLVFDPNGSAFEVYEWPNQPNYYLDLFLGLAAIWRAEHDYEPEPRQEPEDRPDVGH